MNDRTFLQLQAVQLRQLLEDAVDDPILAPQLRQRLQNVEEELAAAPSQSISSELIKRAADRLEQELEEAEITVEGLFRGLTRESLVFDLVTDDQTLITGAIADDLVEEDLDRIDELTNKRCVARLLKTTLRIVAGAPRETYLLLNATPVG